MKNLLPIFFLIIALAGCNSNKGTRDAKDEKNITIFFVNDVHGQLENFAKIKHIVDQAKAGSNVILVCSGDVFSGNAVVDHHDQKGSPIIDLMNLTGFDVITLGNHEFDYGSIILKERMKQSEFDWICANVDMTNSDVPEPLEYTTIAAGELNVTFLGLIETNGKEDAIIPSTHPWRVQDFVFQRPQDVLPNYNNLKKDEGSDLLVALTHLGSRGSSESFGDFQVAEQFPYFDLIIGGHSHQQIDTTINNTPVFQAGSYLNYLGKLEVDVSDKKIQSFTYEQIDLSQYAGYDAEIKVAIDDYNSTMETVLNEVIGTSVSYHSKHSVGCLMAEAQKSRTGADLSFQNTGGVRSTLDQGSITVGEIYEIDPFSNSMVVYQKSVDDIETFLETSNSGFYYHGVEIRRENGAVQLYNSNSGLLDDQSVLSVAVNDYVAAVHSDFFGPNGDFLSYTSAECLIYYLQSIESEVDYSSSECYFRFD